MSTNKAICVCLSLVQNFYRYSHFHVNEIGLDGKIVHLTDLSHSSTQPGEYRNSFFTFMSFMFNYFGDIRLNL